MTVQVSITTKFTVLTELSLYFIFLKENNRKTAQTITGSTTYHCSDLIYTKLSRHLYIAQWNDVLVIKGWYLFKEFNTDEIISSVGTCGMFSTIEVI